MDGQRFDELTRALSAGASRRRVLRGLAAGAAGALAGAVGLRRAGAGVPSVNCSAYGRVCTYTGCCRDGAECVCYRNGHCRCLCPEGSSFANGACATQCAQVCHDVFDGTDAAACTANSVEGCPGDCFCIQHRQGDVRCLSELTSTACTIGSPELTCAPGQTCFAPFGTTGGGFCATGCAAGEPFIYPPRD